jgi:hypothetical protein
LIKADASGTLFASAYYLDKKRNVNQKSKYVDLLI